MRESKWCLLRKKKRGYSELRRLRIYMPVKYIGTYINGYNVGNY